MYCWIGFNISILYLASWNYLHFSWNYVCGYVVWILKIQYLFFKKKQPCSWWLRCQSVCSEYRITEFQDGMESWRSVNTISCWQKMHLGKLRLRISNWVAKTGLEPSSGHAQVRASVHDIQPPSKRTVKGCLPKKLPVGPLGKTCKLPKRWRMETMRIKSKSLKF